MCIRNTFLGRKSRRTFNRKERNTGRLPEE
jgi:hypothetical protein